MDANSIRIIRRDNIILLDTREQQGDYIKSRLDSIGVLCEITTLPQQSGCDYFISGSYGSVAIQRKDSTRELMSQLEEIRFDILPRLISFSSHAGATPVLFIEESHIVGEGGSLFRKQDKVWMETGLKATSYYNYLETIRNMGVDVVTVRKPSAAVPDETIWWLASMDMYLQKNHYPRQVKSFKPEQMAIGMLCCVNGIGEKRAEKALKAVSIAEMMTAGQVPGLTDNMLQKLRRVLLWKE